MLSSLPSLAGGALIGLSAVLLLVLKGRISGVVGGLFGAIDARLVPHHSDYDRLIFNQSRMGKSSGATRIWMLRATPG
jgi:hypothetical protein